MGKLLTIASIVTVVGLTLLSTGCNTSGCVEMRSSVPRADFYSYPDMQPLRVDSLQITGVGVPGDSILYGLGEQLSSIYLPVPPAVNKVSWRIAYMQKELAEFDLADTITLTYNRQPWFAGPDCGAMYKYLITDIGYTTHIIESVAIVDSLVVNIDRTTLNIYFRTE